VEDGEISDITDDCYLQTLQKQKTLIGFTLLLKHNKMEPLLGAVVSWALQASPPTQIYLFVSSRFMKRFFAPME
jgi:hypothetical protein